MAKTSRGSKAAKLAPPAAAAGTAAAAPAPLAPAIAIADCVVTVSAPGGGLFPPGIYNVLLDGHALAQIDLPRPSGTARFSIPPHLLPFTADLVHAATGQRLLPHPLALDDALDIAITRASLNDGYLIVDLSMLGRPVPSLAVMAVAEAEDLIYAAGLAEAMGPEETAPERTRYRADIPFRHLLPIDRPIALTLYLSGRRLEPPLVGTALNLGVAGYVDRASPEMISGWAADLRDHARCLTIDLKQGERLIGSVVAEEPRPDLLSLGLPEACGFCIPYTMFAGLADGDELSIQLGGKHTHLIGSPKTISIAADLRGLFDNIDGNLACGWVIDMADPQRPCRVEALCEGRVIGEAVADGIRRDVLEAGLPTERCGFRIAFKEPLHTLFDKDISVRVKGTETYLNGGPQQPRLNPNIRRYLLPDRGLPPAAIARFSARINRQIAASGLGLSIVMPIYNTRREWLVEALRSVCTQWCGAWELLCVDDASTEPQVAEVLSWFARLDPRIRPLSTGANRGIAGATTLGIMAARYPYTALMDHDDVLEPDAVYQLLKAARDTGAELIYSDEALTTEDSSVILDVRGRPAFSYDYYLSHPYFVHMIALRTEIAQSLGGFDERLPISADVDFVLRAIEASRAVAHVPRVLYRWRTHGASAGHAKQAQVMEASTAALQRHLDRVGAGGRARAAAEFNQFEITWPDPGGRVLIVIPTKDGIDVLSQCIDSIERTTPASEYRLVVIDHESKQPKSKRYLAQIAKRHTVMPYKGIFNYALMNNRAVTREGKDEPFVLMMNNDIEVVSPGWLQRMRSLAARPDVGIVGTALMYSDKRVQHGGVIIGINDLADHALRFEPVWQDDGSRTLGYNSSLSAVRDFSAVTAACMMMRRAVFDEVGGFDEEYVVGFNDTDLCLRVGRAGYKIIYDGRTVLYHHESVTRSKKGELKHPKDSERLKTQWAELMKRGDPYYSPLLELYAYDHRLRAEEGCGPAAPRVVPVALARMRPAAPVEPGPATAAASGKATPAKAAPAKDGRPKKARSAAAAALSG
ncbi:glycosyltransferase family 2 protein [Acidisoma sp. C75]